MVLVYPTATHNRLEHSLGVYATAARYCVALWNDPINPFFRQLMTPKHLRTLLCAALCHDIGQYGLAHDFEEARKDLFDHNDLSVKVLDGTADPVACEGLHSVLKDLWQVEPAEVASVLTADPTDLSQPILKRMLRTVVSGPIDVDKADYLIRDSRKLGVPYGDGIDLERLINCLTVTFRKQEGGVYISVGVHENGKIAAEALAFARYALFGSVYWHHTSRSLKSMLHRAIWEALPRATEYLRWQTFSEEFESFALNTVLRREQLNLFDSDDLQLPQAPQLSTGDFRILKWLYGLTSDAGKQLITHILKRDVFKRLMVVSHAKDHKLWESLHQARIEFADFKRYSRFQEIFQKLLVQEIVGTNLGELKKTLPIAKILNQQVIDEIKSEQNANRVLVIIDIPNERPGSPIELEYLSEARIQGRRQLGEVASLEDSLVWKAINTRFVESVGKIRIFVHPKYAAYFEIMTPREVLKTRLQTAENDLREEIKKEEIKNASREREAQV